MAKKKRKTTKKSSRKKRESSWEGALPPLPDRGLLEAMLHNLIGDGPEEDTPEGKAQTLLHEALEEQDDQRRAKLASRALKIWPDCADAYVLLAEQAPSPDGAITLYEKGVAAGQRALGKQAFSEYEGNFWLALETRPYMRARLGLAQTLWTSGRHEEAVAHYREMLRLNPGDNQGVRFLLADALLDLGHDDELRKLLDQFAEDDSAEMAYSRALLAFRTEGDTPQARRLLKKAGKSNKHIPAYLVGNEQIPRDTSGYVSFGGEDEAAAYVGASLTAWRNTPGAISWVREALKLGLPKRGEAPKPSWDRLQGALVQLPQADSEVWEVDIRSVSIPVKEEKVQAWSILVFDDAAQAPLVIEPRTSRPTANQVWELLIEAMRRPTLGDPHRPERIDVRLKAFHSAWKGKLRSIGVECQLSEYLEGAEQVLERLPAMLDRSIAASVDASEGNVPEDSDLAQLEQVADEVWQADQRRLPIWVGEGKPQRPWTALILDTTNDLVLGHELTSEAPEPEWLWRSVAAAMARPAMGEPRRPGWIEVASEEQAGVMRSHLEAIGVECIIRQPLESLDVAFRDMSQHLTGGKTKASLMDVPGMTAAQLASFFAAAAEFYRRAPWRRLASDEVIRVESAKFQSGPWYAVAMGQSGLTLGLVLYDSLETLRAMFDEDTSDKESVRRSSAISVTYGEEFEVPPGDLDAIEGHGWPVASPEAYPHALRLNPGLATRPPLTWELELLEASLRIIPEFARQKAATFSSRVTTGRGEVELTLTRLPPQ